MKRLLTEGVGPEPEVLRENASDGMCGDLVRMLICPVCQSPSLHLRCL